MTQAASVHERVEVTPAEYARDQGITLGAVYAKLWAGRLPARRIMGRWLITVEPTQKRRRSK